MEPGEVGTCRLEVSSADQAADAIWSCLDHRPPRREPRIKLSPPLHHGALVRAHTHARPLPTGCTDRLLTGGARLTLSGPLEGLPSLPLSLEHRSIPASLRCVIADGPTKDLAMPPPKRQVFFPTVRAHLHERWPPHVDLLVTCRFVVMR